MPSRQAERSARSAKREPAAGLRINVLGPIELITLDGSGEGGEAIGGKLTTMMDVVLRELASQPSGATDSGLRARSGDRSYSDAVSDLRTLLQPYGLSISRLRTATPYRVIRFEQSQRSKTEKPNAEQLGAGRAKRAQDTEVPLPVVSDLLEYRKAAQAVLDRAQRDWDDEANPLGGSGLQSLEEAARGVLSMWRTDRAPDKISHLRENAKSKTPSSDLHLEYRLRTLLLRVRTALANGQRSQSRIDDARLALHDVQEILDAARALSIKFADGINLVEFSEQLSRLNAAINAPSVRADESSEVFLAAPMDGASEYGSARDFAMRVVQSLREHCGIAEVFYAGSSIVEREDFEEPAVSMQRNLHPFRSARCFAMIFPESKCSSVLVEAGMALAFGMHSVYFVRRREDLPWMLRDVGSSGDDKLGTVRVVEYRDESDLLRKIRTNGPSLFPRRAQRVEAL